MLLFFTHTTTTTAITTADTVLVPVAQHRQSDRAHTVAVTVTLSLMCSCNAATLLLPALSDIQTAIHRSRQQQLWLFLTAATGHLSKVTVTHVTATHTRFSPGQCHDRHHWFNISRAQQLQQQRNDDYSDDSRVTLAVVKQRCLAN